MVWEPTLPGRWGVGEEEERKQIEKGKMEDRGGGGSSSVCMWVSCISVCAGKNGPKGVVRWVLEKIGSAEAKPSVGEVTWRHR